MNVAVIDSGGANLGSVAFALERLGASVALTRDADRIRSAERVILPGVGAARSAMRALEEAGLVETVRGLTQPVLGICLGLQLLFEHSEEGDTACLGIIPGRVTRLTASRLPHMGWNQCEIRQPDPLLEGLAVSSVARVSEAHPGFLPRSSHFRVRPRIKSGTGSSALPGLLATTAAESPWFYFVHGYAAPLEHAVAVSYHVQPFAAVVRSNNFAACQFHPERSAAAGARILENFLRCK